MSDQNNIHNIQPDTWLASLVGALYFLLTGFMLIQSDIPHEWSVPAWLRTTDWLFLFGLVVPAIGFAAGWALGFPRWSYPYTGGLIAFSWYLVNTSTPFWYNLGYEKQTWGWRAWIPFLLAAATGATLSWISRSRSNSPLPPAGEGSGVRVTSGVRAFFSHIRRDPSLTTYAMFGWMPLIISGTFDEIARPYSLVFMILLTGFMVATAILYQRAWWQENRSLILAIGLLTSLSLAWIGSIAYWLPLDGVYLPGALLWGVVIAAIMLWPIWLMRLAKPGQKAAA